ncbi:annexin ANXC4 [Colletotrichum paranaense]|uniref:Annexin ANXC4 n=1 Tax=Colletotrichum paranaense TaxID=1914294 RepID=A0ABQ9SFU0_9PEZI|nr:annexin ANXC4 [Colletotrichum paranaense]KAK1533912.1 annexin ANXC4 [Colletotrichum paranaense]
MSLQVDDRGRRTRSRSPGRRERSRSPAVPAMVDPPREPSYAYPEDDLDGGRYGRERGGANVVTAEPGASRAMSGAIPYPEDGSDAMFPGTRSLYDYDDPRGSNPAYRPPPSPQDDYYRNSREKYDEPRDDDKLKYLPAKYSSHGRSNSKYGNEAEYAPQKPPRPDAGDLYPPAKPPRPVSPGGYAYAQPQPYEYAKTDDKAKKKEEKKKALEENLAYGFDPNASRPGGLAPEPRYSGRAPSPGPQISAGAAQYYANDPRVSSNVLTVEPGSRRRDKSPQPPTHRMSNLSVNTGHHSMNVSMSLANAPGSPLLESYHGTYQDMSPMPSPMLLPSSHDLQVMEPLSPIGSDDEGRRRRRARFHDIEDDASRIAKALRSDRKNPDPEPLIEILPGLTHDQVMDLRKEYKALVKTGADRKGVNVAKHIRSRLKDSDPNLMKACYATALGQWESEAYWANFWYQGDKTRRELLIESLMGRTNHEIRLIKDGFSDKKYDNSLTKCMKTELKEDKFKKAVLMVLEERRMEEYDPYGRRLAIDYHSVEDDVSDLRKAVKSEKGGESLMISIVVQRSDSHLREVLKLYERTYRTNFARDALKKSGNLVGELLAHVLNGVINRPVRDALLVHHALTASRKDDLRRELLISRLVRFHWDRHHLEAIKRAYRERYGRDMQEAVREGTSGEWGMFCRELCIYRMPDQVKSYEKVPAQAFRELFTMKLAPWCKPSSRPWVTLKSNSLHNLIPPSNGRLPQSIRTPLRPIIHLPNPLTNIRSPLPAPRPSPTSRFDITPSSIIAAPLIMMIPAATIYTTLIAASSVVISATAPELPYPFIPTAAMHNIPIPPISANPPPHTPASTPTPIPTHSPTSAPRQTPAPTPTPLTPPPPIITLAPNIHMPNPLTEVPPSIARSTSCSVLWPSPLLIARSASPRRGRRSLILLNWE